MGKNVKYRGSIRIIDKISEKGLAALQGDYLLGANEIMRPDAIIVRSSTVLPDEYPGLSLIVRAGAGFDNIDISRATHLGIVVSTTPQGNGNAVCELVHTMMGVAYRRVADAMHFVKTMHLPHDEKSIAGVEAALKEMVKKHRGEFGGHELAGRTLGVIGLGQVGVLVANAGITRGMRVQGYEPYATPDNMHQLDPRVERVPHMKDMLEQVDFLTMHIPLNEKTRGFIGEKEIAQMKADCILINYARGEIVDDTAVRQALDEDRLRAYITDFPTSAIYTHPRAMCTPHLGASTKEAGDNCATIAAAQVKAFFERGSVINSVNMPDVELTPAGAAIRLAIINKNTAGMIGKITDIVGTYGYNIRDMVNKSRSSVGYNLIDIDEDVPDTVIGEIRKLEGIMRIRAIRFPR